MNMTDEKPTPETDAFMESPQGYATFAQKVEDFARKLERERDEARETLRNAEAELDVARVERDDYRKDVYALLDALPSGAHDATEGVVAIKAMSEAIEEAYEALKLWPKAGSGMRTDFSKQSKAFRFGQAALAKLQPFINP